MHSEHIGKVREPKRESPRGKVRARAVGLIALLSTIGLVGNVVGPAPASAQSAPQTPLAAGPFSVLQAVLKKSLLRVEVARVQIRVDQPTQRKLEAMIAGRKKTDALSDGVVRAVLGSAEVLITSELRHDVPLDKYIESAYDDLKSAREAGMITDHAYWSLARLMPKWFQALEGRGPRKGDRLLCRVKPEGLQITYRTSDERVLVNHMLPGTESGHAVLASYLAPETTFRKDLIESLFRH